MTTAGTSNIKLDEKTKSPKSSQKDMTPSPGSEKKLSNSSSAAKSSIPKSVDQAKYQSRSQSSYANFNKEKSKENQTKSEDSNIASRGRAASSKTPLGHNAISLTRHNDAQPKIPAKTSRQKSLTATKSLGANSLTYSSPEPSSPVSPSLNETSDDSMAASDNPEEIIKPFIIKKSEPDGSSPHVHHPNEPDGRTPTPACSHTVHLASKKRALNKRPGHLRHMKVLSTNRIQTLRDYLSIYEERLGRIEADKPILLNETKLRLEEVISKATEQWTSLQTAIDQQYAQVIKDTQSHKDNLVKELKGLENLQKESSTLYDICDLEEDDNNLSKWVQSLKDRYNQTLTEAESSVATEYLPSISIESIDRMRADYESKIKQLIITHPIAATPVAVSSAKKRDASPHTSTL